MSRNRLFALLPLFFLLAIVSPVDAGWPYASVEQQSNYIHENTRLKDLDPFSSQSPFFPAFGDYTKVTTIVQRYDERNSKRAKGNVITEVDCFSNQVNGRRSLGRGKDKFDAYGNAVNIKMVSPSKGCDFFGATTRFGGGQKQLDGSSVSVTTGVQRLGAGADSDCFDENTLCLGDNGRFKVRISWEDFQDSGSGVPLATGFDTGLFYFFDSDNREMLIKVLDGCDFNNHYWVFAASASNVEYTLTVTDTATNQSRTYANPLGQRADAVQDTEAFFTCP